MNINTVKAYLQLIRAPAVFTVCSNIFAAQILATGGNLDVSAFLITLIVSTAIYWAGMIMNDCVDINEDRKDRPFRPLPSNQIRLSTAWTMVILLLGTAIVLSYFLSIISLLITVTLIVSVITYNAWSKKYFIGVFNMGLCRYLNWLLGLSVAPVTYVSYILSLPILAYVTTLTILSRSETNASNRNHIVFCLLGILATLLLIVLNFNLGIFNNIWGLATTVTLAIFLTAKLYAVYRNFQPAGIQNLMKLMILGIILLDSVMLLSGGYWQASFVVLLLLIPGRLLAKWIYIT